MLLAWAKEIPCFEGFHSFSLHGVLLHSGVAFVAQHRTDSKTVLSLVSGVWRLFETAFDVRTHIVDNHAHLFTKTP